MSRAMQRELFPEEVVPHVARPDHMGRHPVQVSMKRVRLAPSLRQQRVHKAIVEQVGRAVRERGVKVLHFSVEHDELNLMVEGADKKDLARQLQFLFSRVAFEVNRVAHRHGSLFRDRHRRRPLTTPIETRRALVGLLLGSRARTRRKAPSPSPSFDTTSSAPWFEHWDPVARPPPTLVAEARAQHPGPAPILTKPTTWLARAGWRRAGGLLRLDERPSLPNLPG